jgi:hypothetical protein
MVDAMRFCTMTNLMKNLSRNGFGVEAMLLVTDWLVCSPFVCHSDLVQVKTLLSLTPPTLLHRGNNSQKEKLLMKRQLLLPREGVVLILK